MSKDESPTFIQASEKRAPRYSTHQALSEERTMNRRHLLASVLSLAVPAFAQAQSWPAQPVRVMIGFPPGGTTDVIGRLTANELSEQLGKPFVVENRGGASGTIGAGVVAKSAVHPAGTGQVGPHHSRGRHQDQLMIVLENVAKRFGAVQAVDGVSFRAEKGKFVVLLGPRGGSARLRLYAYFAAASSFSVKV